VSIQREAVEVGDRGVTGRERGKMDVPDGGGQGFSLSQEQKRARDEAR
jgi:hypothetical protein